MDLKYDEYELIKRIANGERDLFSLIIRKYQKKVAAIVYSFLYNKNDIDEVVQDVFCNVYTAIERFKNNSQFSTYVYKIAVNRTIKWNKKSGRLFYIEDYNQYESMNDETHKGITEDRKAVLGRAIGKLSENQRQALSLYTFDEFSYKEIADIMSLSLSSVESLIFRAKVNLKKMLIEKY